MDKGTAFSYFYAKASGILAKSFVGERTGLLFAVKSLSELWTLLFNSEVPAFPEKILAQKIEKQAFDNFISTYIGFINLFDKPDEILLRQLSIFEAENIKEIAAALCSNEGSCPDLIDLKKMTNLKVQYWPDIKKITEKSEFSWYDKVPNIHEQQKNEFKIDLQIIRSFWNSLNYLPKETFNVLREMYQEQFIIKNIVWALRLKLYFNMSNEDIKKNLIYVTDNISLQDPIAGEALNILDKDVDNYDQWKNWKYYEYINPHVDGQLWTIDPSWIEKSSRIQENKTANLLFHQYSQSTVALIAWFRIKNYELSCIRTSVESLKLNINSNEAMNAVGLI